MIELKTPAEIQRMRVTGRFVAEVLTEVGRLADVGVNLLDLRGGSPRRSPAPTDRCTACAAESRHNG